MNLTTTKGKHIHTGKRKLSNGLKKYSDDILRPVFEWSGQQGYYIINGKEPNPFYKQARFRRVGCFPCIMSGQKEVYEIVKRYPEKFNEIVEHEKRIGSSFFKIDFVPEYAHRSLR